MAYINGHELLFGVLTLPVGGSAVGEAEAASTAKSLTITDLGNWRYNAAGLITALQDLWDWDDENALTWGCFSLTRSGSSGIALKDSYNDSAALYGGEWNVSATTSDSVKIVKNDSYMMLDMPGGAIVFFTAKDENGTEYKCIAGAKTGSTYKIYLGADDTTAAFSYKVENNAGLRTTTALYELTPFFSEITGGVVETADVAIVRSCPAITRGLYSIGDDQYYFGNFIAIKDG